MEKIEIIRDVKSLVGTCYIEINLGKYEKCWQKTSLYFSEDIFGLIEPVFEKSILSYGHYAFNEIEKKAWFLIIFELQKMKNFVSEAGAIDDLVGKVGFIYRETRAEFQSDFMKHKQELVEMIDDFILWLQQNLKKYDNISVLGL